MSVLSFHCTIYGAQMQVCRLVTSVPLPAEPALWCNTGFRFWELPQLFSSSTPGTPSFSLINCLISITQQHSSQVWNSNTSEAEADFSEFWASQGYREKPWLKELKKKKKGRGYSEILRVSETSLAPPNKNKQRQNVNNKIYQLLLHLKYTSQGQNSE